MQSTILYGLQRGSIRKLSGFKAIHHLPTEYNASSIEFVQKIGAENIKQIASEILEHQRTIFDLKRIDYNIDIQNGAVAVETPQLSFVVSITLDTKQNKQYLIRTEVSAFKETNLTNQFELLNSLNSYCNLLSICSNTTINIEDFIDKIEAIDELRHILSYPIDATECSLRFEKYNIDLKISDKGIEIDPIIPKGLVDLFKNSSHVLSLLNQSSPGFEFALFA